MNILGIESTCDETGVAVVKDGTDVIVNLISSSVEVQTKFKGVVPEIAAREQTKVIIPLIAEVVESVGVKNIDAIAVSYGPGLIGSLLVGVESAKAIAYAWEKPLIRVNHLTGHFFANLLFAKRPVMFPAVALIVSGGHTDLLYLENELSYKLIGATLDDAAGEAFDKVAKILGLKYPGGPEVEKKALEFADSGKLNPFPKPLINSDNFNFSFSGLKTSVANFVEKNDMLNASEVCYFFQESVVDVLVSKTIAAASKYSAKSIVIGGGVSANTRLRKEFELRAKNYHLFHPKKKYSVDNGAMIAAAAFFNKDSISPLKLSADPSLHF